MFVAEVADCVVSGCISPLLLSRREKDLAGYPVAEGYFAHVGGG